jgi:hypothetical protein
MIKIKTQYPLHQWYAICGFLVENDIITIIKVRNEVQKGQTCPYCMTGDGVCTSGGTTIKTHSISSKMLDDKK